MEAGQGLVSQRPEKGLQCGWHAVIRRREVRQKEHRLGGWEAGRASPSDHSQNGCRVIDMCRTSQRFELFKRNGLLWWAENFPSLKLLSAVLKHVMPDSLGLGFGITIVLITCCLVRFSPSLQPEELFSEKHLQCSQWKPAERG